MNDTGNAMAVSILRLSCDRCEARQDFPVPAQRSATAHGWLLLDEGSLCPDHAKAAA